MSTVKIKTEPATAATTTTAVNVQVKLEPSLSTADIKIEQHSSDIDSKFESDSEVDSDIKSESDDNSDGTDQSHSTESPKNQRLFRCEHPGCGRSFNSSGNLGRHHHEHRLQAELNIFGKSYTLVRHSLNDRWPCPVPDCESEYKTINTAHTHIQKAHRTSLNQKGAGSDDDSQLLQIIKKKRHTFQYLNVDDFYVCDTRYCYHTTTGLFICRECRLVPECLLTHLQQKHGYSEKSIDNAFLPESARTTGSDPNGNQYNSNSHLAAAIRDPYQWRNSDIVQGCLCIKPDCGFCHCTKESRYTHHYLKHRGEQQSIVPALVLRLLYAKERSSCFLITRLDTATNNTNPSSSTGQQNNECEDDDGDELVLSDYSDEDDIH